MFTTIFLVYKVSTVAALLLTVRCGYIAAVESDSPRKGKARFIATFLVGAWICTSGLLMFFYDRSLPIFEFAGRIESINIRNSTSKRYSADLHIQTTTGGKIEVHASDRNEGFRSGQRVKVRYRGDTGELVSAIFCAEDGRQEGVSQSTVTWRQLILIPFGLFFIWVAFRKYHRDPESAEN